MDKSLLIHKQVRNNTEDLQKEFLDMKTWEEQMKRKDAELRDSGECQVLPPIRSKKVKHTSKSIIQNDEKSSKPKRIKSYDYKSWDKFDVDKACEDVDKNGESGEEEIELTTEELEKKHNEATKFKEAGNTYVKKKEWEKAISCYSEAITIFPYDAAFYANRALCHLKLDNLYSTEADCTVAIQLDEMYIKAYHRRATARIELKQYDEAKQDIEKVLKLEPSNKEAKLLMAQINKIINKQKPVIITKNDNEDEVPIKEKIDEKLLERKVPEDDEKMKGKNPEDISNESENKPTEEEEKSLTWLPDFKDDFEVVQSIKKLPHLRSQKPLKRIEIKEANFGYSVLPKSMQEFKSKEENHMPKIPQNMENIGEIALQEKVKKVLIEIIDEDFEVPPAPKTSVQFIFNWKKTKSTAFRYKFLKLLSPEDLPGLFQDSLEYDTLSEILITLNAEFIRRHEPVFQYLEHLSNVKRFRALTLFLNKIDKEALEKLLIYSKTVEKKTAEEIMQLRQKYEL